MTFREAWNGRFKGGEGYAKWQEYQINKKMLLSSRHFSLYKDTNTQKNKSSLIPSCYVGSCKRFVQHGSRTNAKRRPYPQMLCQNRFLQTFRFKWNQCRSLRHTYIHTNTMPLIRWKINSFSPPCIPGTKRIRKAVFCLTLYVIYVIYSAEFLSTHITTLPPPS